MKQTQAQVQAKTHLLIPEGQFGRLTLLFMAGGGLFALIALWQWRVILAIAFVTLILSYTGVRIYMLFSMHRLEIEEARQSMEPEPVPLEDVELENYDDPYALPNLDPELEPETKSSMTFEDMIGADIVHPGSDFTLAYADEFKPIQFPKLTSLGIGGFPGSGKTVTTLVVMLEAVAKYNGNIKFIVADPHMYVSGDESLVSKIAPLSEYFLTIEDILATVPDDDHDYRATLKRAAGLSNPTEGGEELRTWMKIVQLEMESRKQGKVGDTWVIVMDEFVGIMNDTRVAGPVSSVIEVINQQARKMNMFSLLISQQWKASALNGSTDLRQSIPTFIAHQMPEAIASLIVPSDIARQVSKLETGQVIIYSGGTAQVGRVPFATSLDAEFIAAYYQPFTPKPTRLITGGDITVKLNVPKPKAVIPDDFMRSELEEIRKSYVNGLSESGIAKKIYGVKSGPELEEAVIQVRKQLQWLAGREI